MIIDIKKINLDNFEELKRKAEIIIKYDLFKEAFELSRLLDERLKNDKILSGDDNYFYILNKLRWIALPRLRKGEVFGLFKDNFSIIFDIEKYDIIAKLKSKIINDIPYEERDNFKNKLKKGLLGNEEKITSQKIIVSEKLLRPTISNWLKDYNISVGTNIVDEAKRIQYLTYGDNIKKVDKLSEKEKLKILFSLYDMLKTSSLSPEGIEENIVIEEKDGLKGVIKDGLFIKVDNKLSDRIELMKKIINGDETEPEDKLKITPEEREAYKHEKVEKLENQFGEELEKRAIEEEILGDDISGKKKELENMLKLYKEGSLERKVIQDELDTI